MFLWRTLTHTAPLASCPHTRSYSGATRPSVASSIFFPGHLVIRSLTSSMTIAGLVPWAEEGKLAHGPGQPGSPGVSHSPTCIFAHCHSGQLFFRCMLVASLHGETGATNSKNWKCLKSTQRESLTAGTRKPVQGAVSSHLTRQLRAEMG